MGSLWRVWSLARSELVRRRITCALLCLLLAVSGWLRWDELADKRCLKHDEAITLLGAAGHLVDFGQRNKVKSVAFDDHWQPTAEAQAFQQVTEPFCYGKIQSGQASHDIHPPLYFWLLHTVGVATPLAANTGGQLNVLLHMLGCLLLFLLARRLSISRPLSLATVAFWTFSKAALVVTVAARPYELAATLALAAALLTVEVLSPASRFRRWKLMLLAVTCAALLLTLYQTSLAVAAVVSSAALACLPALLGARWTRLSQQARRGGWAILAVAVGVAVFWLMNPGFLEPLQAKLERSLAATHRGDSLTRPLRLLGRFLDLNPKQWTLASVCWVAGGIIAFVSIRAGWCLRAQRDREAWKAMIPTLWAIALFVGPIVQFLLLLTPRHALGDERYLSMGWPILTLFGFHALEMGIQALRSLASRLDARIHHIPFAGALGVVVLWTSASAGFQHAPKTPWLCGGKVPYGGKLGKYEHVIINNTARGHLGALLPLLDPNGQIYLTKRSNRLRRLTRNLERLESNGPILVIHVPGGRVRRSHGKELFRAVERAGFVFKKRQRGRMRVAQRPETPTR